MTAILAQQAVSVFRTVEIYAEGWLVEAHIQRGREQQQQQRTPEQLDRRNLEESTVEMYIEAWMQRTNHRDNWRGCRCWCSSSRCRCWWAGGSKMSDVLVSKPGVGAANWGWAVERANRRPQHLGHRWRAEQGQPRTGLVISYGVWSTRVEELAWAGTWRCCNATKWLMLAENILTTAANRALTSSCTVHAHMEISHSHTTISIYLMRFRFTGEQSVN